MTMPVSCAALIATLIAGDGNPANDMQAIAVFAVEGSPFSICRRRLSVTHDRPLQCVCACVCVCVCVCARYTLMDSSGCINRAQRGLSDSFIVRD